MTYKEAKAYDLEVLLRLITNNPDAAFKASTKSYDERINEIKDVIKQQNQPGPEAGVRRWR